MKQLLYFTSVLLLLSSCSTLDSVDSLVRKADTTYCVNRSSDGFYTAKVPMRTLVKRNEMYKIRKAMESQNSEPTILESIFEFDSVGFINISFEEQLIKNNSIPEFIYYWDYSNARFLVPFLPFGNEEHKRNQCVNRAIEACYKSDMSTVVISPTLNHFKLYK